jgi:hypothetical protein
MTSDGDNDLLPGIEDRGRGRRRRGRYLLKSLYVRSTRGGEMLNPRTFGRARPTRTPRRFVKNYLGPRASRARKGKIRVPSRSLKGSDQ